MDLKRELNNPVSVQNRDKNVKRSDVLNSYSAITRKYFPILAQLDDVQSFRVHKADILTSGQIAVLKAALSPEKIKKASFINLCQGFKILNEACRLEENLSTENHAHQIFGKFISD